MYYNIEYTFKTKNESVPLGVKLASMLFETSQITEQQGLANTRETEIDLLAGRDNKRWGTEVDIVVKIQEYFNTSTIFDLGLITGTDDKNVRAGRSTLFAKYLIFSDSFRTFIFDDEFKRPSRLTIKFASNPSVETYIRKPLGLVQGLAKIGGFLGFMKLFSIFLSLMHQWLFERELRAVLK